MTKKTFVLSAVSDLNFFIPVDVIKIGLNAFKNLQWSPIGFEGELGSVVRPCPNHTIRSSQNPDSELVPQTQMTTMTILFHQNQKKTMAPT